VARRKIETGAGRVEGKQAALEQEREPNKVFQNGACPVSLNLIGNAIKFTERGHIRVAVAAAFPVKGRVLLHFGLKDTGIGIPAEMEEKIFEAFSQADGSKARKYGGTGVGLAICVRLVEMMGRRIWVESAPRKGSILHFTLDLALAAGIEMQGGDQLGPREAAAQMSPPPSANPKTFTGNGGRVLLVENNAVNRILAQRLLQKRGFAVSITADGKQAIAAMHKTEFDLVLMDIQMPEMDGFEATTEIRNHEKLTGHHALKEDRERCLSAGMDPYVTKPIHPEELFRVIQEVLQSSSAWDPSTTLTPAPSSR
jgi:CheY-like chemotaxis protein